MSQSSHRNKTSGGILPRSLISGAWPKKARIDSRKLPCFFDKNANKICGSWPIDLTFRLLTEKCKLSSEHCKLINYSTLFVKHILILSPRHKLCAFQILLKRTKRQNYSSEIPRQKVAFSLCKEMNGNLLSTNCLLTFEFQTSNSTVVSNS